MYKLLHVCGWIINLRCIPHSYGIFLFIEKRFLGKYVIFVTSVDQSCDSPGCVILKFGNIVGVDVVSSKHKSKLSFTVPHQMAIDCVVDDR